MDKLVFIITYIMVILATASCDTTLSPDPDITTETTDCIVITNCPLAIELLKNRNVSALRVLYCGFEGKYPKVMCNGIPAKNENNIIIFNNTIEVATSRPKKTTTTKRYQISLEEPTTAQPEVDMKSSYPFPSRKVCGQNKAKIGHRISGGVLTDIEEYPWLARINYKNRITGKDEHQLCAASLITDRYLLTAAHCVKNTMLQPLKVRLGEWDEETETDCIGNRCNDKPVDININSTIMHPLFDRRTMANDIALLRLEEPVKFTEFIQPICLPTSEYVASADYVTGSTFWTAGWGLTEFGTTSPIKRKVELDAVSIEVCQGIYSHIAFDTSTVICAGGRKGYDSCRGDSGGSLIREIMEDDNTNWYILGITSFGTAICGAEGKPGIYTRVAPYMEWIEKNVK